LGGGLMLLVDDVVELSRKMMKMADENATRSTKLQRRF
jgi:hypothetical protein